MYRQVHFSSWSCGLLFVRVVQFIRRTVQLVLFLSVFLFFRRLRTFGTTRNHLFFFARKRRDRDSKQRRTSRDRGSGRSRDERGGGSSSRRDNRDSRDRGGRGRGRSRSDSRERSSRRDRFGIACEEWSYTCILDPVQMRVMALLRLKVEEVLLKICCMDGGIHEWCMLTP